MKDKLKQFSNEELESLILAVLQANDLYALHGKHDWMINNESLAEVMLEMLDLMKEND